MNVDRILETMNRHHVGYILIGGVNFLLRHTPVITYDVDLWIEDTQENRDHCESALAELDAEWGVTEEDWGPVAQKRSGWLLRFGVLCLTSPYGAIDIFRSVAGLGDWKAARDRACQEVTNGGVSYLGLSDNDMLQCQLALDEPQQKSDRIGALRKALESRDE